MMEKAGGMDVNSLMQRLRRLAMLDTTVFDEVKGDKNSTIPAIVVVAVSTLLSGLGGWLWWVFADLPESGDVLLKSFVFGSILSMVLWGVWVGLTYVMLSQVFRARVDSSELVRVMGFAAAPLGLSALMFVPVLDFGIGLTSLALLFGVNVIAVQSATDAPAGRVLAATGAGFLVWAVVLSLFISNANAYAPGFFLFDVGAELLRDVGSAYG